MGSDCEARLCWGIPYTREELGEQFADQLFNRAWDLSQARLQAAVPKPEGVDQQSPEWEAWKQRRSAWEIGQPGLLRRGYADVAPGPLIYMRASDHSVKWDQVLTIEPGMLKVDPDWEPVLWEYCETLGLPWKQPGWFLSAYYG